MDAFDPTAYGPAFASLLRDAPLSPLDAGHPDPVRRPLLASLTDDAFQPLRVVNSDMAAACRAGLWLLFDFLDDSHRISQEIDAPEGAYWHALMHRREEDFSNSKYWFRRVGRHPVFGPLRLAAREAAGDAEHPSAGFLTTQTAWDPFTFVDLCEASLSEDAPSEKLCRRIQQAEWQLLFEHCYRSAVELNE